MADSGIYSITNIANGKCYIGSAVDIKSRWRVHRHGLSRGTHHCAHLQRAWVKHGAAAFRFDVVEAVTAPDDLIAREQFHIDRVRPEYNCCKTAGSVLGFRHSADTRKNMSSAKLGTTLSDEHKANIGTGSLKAWARRRDAGQTGWSHRKERSPEHRAQIAESKRKFWAERKAAGLAGFKHPPRTEDQRKRISDAAKLAWARRNPGA